MGQGQWERLGQGQWEELGQGQWQGLGQGQRQEPGQWQWEGQHPSKQSQQEQLRQGQWQCPRHQLTCGNTWHMCAEQSSKVPTGHRQCRGHRPSSSSSSGAAERMMDCANGRRNRTGVLPSRWHQLCAVGAPDCSSEQSTCSTTGSSSPHCCQSFPTQPARPCCCNNSCCCGQGCASTA